MRGKLLAILSIVMGVFVCLFAVPMIYVNIIEDGIFSLDTFIGYSLLLFGLAPIYFGIMRITFKIRVNETISLLEQYQNPYGVDISVISSSLGITDERTTKLIQELIFYGYVNRIFIDYVKKKVIYLDSANVQGEENINFVHVRCNNCGGTSAVLKGSAYQCEYCGAHAFAQGIADKVVLVDNTTYSAAETQSLKENLRFGCLLPLSIPLVFLFLVSLFYLFTSDAALFNRLGSFIVVGLPLGVFTLVFSIKLYNALMDKYTRPLVAKYLFTIIGTRKPEGVFVKDLAAQFGEDPKMSEKNIKFLIKRKHLVGVTVKGAPPKVFFLDDGTDYNRFIHVQCKICGGEFVATHGKANKCPYCGNGVHI